MRKHSSIMAFVLITLFTISTLAPLSNAAFTHQDLTLALLINDEDVSKHSTSNNPLKISVDEDMDGKFSISNNGDTVHLTDMSIELYRVQRILLWNWESWVFGQQIDVDGNDKDGDGKEGFDVPAGFSRSERFTVHLSNFEEVAEQLRGQSFRIDVNFNFETIPDYTVTVYVDFV